MGPVIEQVQVCDSRGHARVHARVQARVQTRVQARVHYQLSISILIIYNFPTETLFITHDIISHFHFIYLDASFFASHICHVKKDKK